MMQTLKLFFLNKKNVLLCFLFLLFFIPSLSLAQEQKPNTSPQIQAQEKTEVIQQKPAEPNLLARFNSTVAGVLFFDLAFGKIKVESKTVAIPFLVVFLFLGGIFFSFYFRFIHIRAFKHAFDIIRGKFASKKDKGEISHFKALASALSATVGLGNIAGVAVAIQLGGPGAVFWMLVAAFFGMSLKFTSCSLAQMYRKMDEKGEVTGGPMYYLYHGLGQLKTKARHLATPMASLYAFGVVAASFGAGNMFQANQSFEAFATSFGTSDWVSGSQYSWFYGAILALLVGLVVLGGIRRIAAATSKIVPLMCGLYVLAALYILVVNAQALPEAIATIFRMAFSDNAAYGGAIGVAIWGIRRAHFSNESGLGSSAIVHAAAKESQPVREGFVAMLEPFIDTIIVCTMTALVVIVTGAWADPAIPQKAGVSLTTAAFSKDVFWFGDVLTVCVFLFAYSTMLAWCYYGERGLKFLAQTFKLNQKLSLLLFRLCFIMAVVAGAVYPLSDVLNFADLMVLSLAFPNILGLLILAPKLKQELNRYWQGFRG